MIIADPGVGTAIGRAYLDADPHRGPVREAYRHFVEETYRQLDAIMASGIDVSVVDTDPYENFTAMAYDVRHNHHLAAMSSATTGGHPILTDEENDAFRLVHDYHGHFKTRRCFDRHGEEAAWWRHSRMYGLAARWAMTTETRGQSSAFIWHLGGKTFPEQKAALLPAWCVNTPPKRK